MQSPGRAAEVQFFGHGDEIAEVTHVHYCTRDIKQMKVTPNRKVMPNQLLRMRPVSSCQFHRSVLMELHSLWPRWIIEINSYLVWQHITLSRL